MNKYLLNFCYVCCTQEGAGVMMVSKAGRVLVLGELTVEWERHNEPIAACVERKTEGEGGKF